MELERSLPPLDDERLARVVARVREHEPATAAIVVTGSYAKGVADDRSDLDVNAITRSPQRTRYRMWFDGSLHVSLSAKTVDMWLERAARPEAWGLGFPCTYDGVYVWSEEDVRAALGEPPTQVHPPADPEIEDFVESSLKARRGGTSLRVYARAAAELAPGILRPLNPTRVVRDRLEAIDAALSLPVAPPGWRQDLAVCLGLVPSSDEDLAAASSRLARGVLALVRETDPTIDPQPDIARYLREGTLERLFDGD